MGINSYPGTLRARFLVGFEWESSLLPPFRLRETTCAWVQLSTHAHTHTHTQTQHMLCCSSHLPPPTSSANFILIEKISVDVNVLSIVNLYLSLSLRTNFIHTEKKEKRSVFYCAVNNNCTHLSLSLTPNVNSLIFSFLFGVCGTLHVSPMRNATGLFDPEEQNTTLKIRRKCIRTCAQNDFYLACHKP